MGISKGGDTYIRTLLVHGARSVLFHTGKKTDGKDIKLRRWIKSVWERRGYNKAAVALANKLARMAWAIIKEGSSYNSNYKPFFIKAA